MAELTEPRPPSPDPCPFCGKRRLRIERDGGLSRLYCVECHAEGPTVSQVVSRSVLDDDIEAITAWNKRAVFGVDWSQTTSRGDAADDE